jgi:hypothetical protein
VRYNSQPRATHHPTLDIHNFIDAEQAQKSKNKLGLELELQQKVQKLSPEAGFAGSRLGKLTGAVFSATNRM